MSLSQDVRPRFGRIPAAKAYCGLGRSSLYELAAENPGLFVKFGGATLVDFAKLDEILGGLPLAQIKLSGKRAAA